MTDRDLCIHLLKELRKSKEQERRAKELSDWYLERIAMRRDSVSLADATLKSFEEGGIGMKYILKYAKAWAGYKLRNNSICPISPSSGEQKKRIKKIRYKAKLVLSSDQLKCKCPCCGMRFPSFVAGDYINHAEIFNPDRYIHTRQEVLCPECQSLPRHRILASWLNEHLVQPATILYFAEEHCMDLWMKYNGIKCITADLEQPANLKIDIQKTGLKRNCFDMIICNHVLEHVDDFRMALRELYRILKPGGRLICSFPMDPRIEFLDEDPDVIDREERRLRFGQYDHKRVFGMHADVFLKEAGFKVEKIKGEDYPDEILPVVGPADYDMNCLFCCTKMKEPNVEKS